MKYSKIFFYFKKVLIVEDNIVNQKIMAELIKDYCEFEIANNGEDGLKLFLKDDFDLIITDISMPIMNGLVMTKKIKEINPNQQIMVLSDFNDSEILIRLMNIGISNFIPKPIYKEMFYKEIEKLYNLIANKTISNYYELSQKEFEKKLSSLSILFFSSIKTCTQFEKISNFFSSNIKEVEIIDDIHNLYKFYINNENRLASFDIVIVCIELASYNLIKLIKDIEKINTNVKFIFIGSSSHISYVNNDTFSYHTVIKPVSLKNLLKEIYDLYFLDYTFIDKMIVNYEKSLILNNELLLEAEDLDKIVDLADDYEEIISNMIYNDTIVDNCETLLTNIINVLRETYNIYYTFIDENIKEAIKPFADVIISFKEFLKDIKSQKLSIDEEVIEAIEYLLEDMLGFIKSTIETKRYVHSEYLINSFLSNIKFIKVKLNIIEENEDEDEFF